MAEKKLNIEIFVPLSSCACVFQHYLDRVFQILLPYKNEIDFQVKNASGVDGERYQIIQNTVVVNESQIFTHLDIFKNFLETTFPEIAAKSHS